MNHEIVLSTAMIESRIFTIRGLQVMIDKDLAELYQVEVKRLNEQVKRNSERFPELFRFQLNDVEKIELVANCDRFENMKHSSSNPHAFTEQGVAMLSAVLRSEIAVKVSIQIMTAFVGMRKVLIKNEGIMQRLNKLEHNQTENEIQFEKIFKALESKEIIPSQGVFFDGQVFDAYELVSRIIRQARQSIILIDNYIDESVLVQLAKKIAGVKVLLLTHNISHTLKLDVEKANRQYPAFEVKKFNKSHDRFLITDQTEIYHLGASLKDLGKKWFAFSRMDKSSVSVLKGLKEWV